MCPFFKPSNLLAVIKVNCLYVRLYDITYIISDRLFDYDTIIMIVADAKYIRNFLLGTLVQFAFAQT